MADLDIPPTLAAVDADWLTAALRAGGRFFTRADATVSRVEPGEPVGGIAVTSCVARLRLQLEPTGAGPDSVFVKVANPAWTRGSALHQREVRFYTELAGEVRLPIPRCYYAAYDAATGAFVLVLEDVGDAEPGHRLDGVRDAEAELLFDGLADLHRTWWESPRLRQAHWPTKTYSRERAAEILATFRRAWPQLRADGRFAVSAELEAVVAGLGDSFVDDMFALSASPRTLIHSDLHAENFVIDARERPRIIAFDWQNASFANPCFDVTNALTSLAPDVSVSARVALLDRYHARLNIPSYARDYFAAQASAAVRWQFVGGANWFVVFEAENLRDAETVQGHWTRLSAALLASATARS